MSKHVEKLKKLFAERPPNYEKIKRILSAHTFTPEELLSAASLDIAGLIGEDEYVEP